MINEEPKKEENPGNPEPPGEGDKLRDVLHKSKLQISVLKKMLEQIPVNPPKENQTP